MSKIAASLCNIFIIALTMSNFSESTSIDMVEYELWNSDLYVQYQNPLGEHDHLDELGEESVTLSQMLEDFVDGPI